jgi:hypothetical protein
MVGHKKEKLIHAHCWGSLPIFGGFLKTRPQDAAHLSGCGFSRQDDLSFRLSLSDPAGDTRQSCALSRAIYDLQGNEPTGNKPLLG